MSRSEHANSREQEVQRVPPGASVVVRTGFYEGYEVALDRDWMVIGRGRGADILIAEPTISRAHAAIGYEAGRYIIQDLGSTNGTLVNGARVQRHPLKANDEIQMGRLVIAVSLPSRGA